MAETIYETIKDSDGVECFIKRGNLVRCKDCKHYSWHTDSCDHIGGIVSKDFFCADGERMEGETK